jgi:multiple sugar transport system substrate-binding protein
MRIRTIVPLVCCVALLGACGEDSESDGGAPAQAGSTEGSKKAPTLEESRDATGEVTVCAGKDTSGALTEAIKLFNDRYGSQGLEAKKLELEEGADEVRNQFVQRAQAKSEDCDVLQADIIWIAEFAQQQWLLDMTDYVAARKDEFIPSTLAPFHYDGKYWGVPQVTGAGLLYRRTDQVPDPPESWQELYRAAAEHDGMAYQGAAYEGLTCNFLELAAAAGGRVLSEDGTEAELDSPENLEALKFMAEGVDSGAALRAAVTYMEEPARLAFEGGRATFMRNWSYAYATGKKAPKVKDRFEVTPLPPFEGAGSGGVLGGNGPVVTAFSDNPKAGVLWSDFWTSPETIRRNAAKYALPPVLVATYEEPSVKKAIPYAAELEQAVEQASPRPVSPVYPQITQAIYRNVNAALAGEISPEEALRKGQAEIEQALTSF